jgi:lysophospholipase L1-like esterase
VVILSLSAAATAARLRKAAWAGAWSGSLLAWGGLLFTAGIWDTCYTMLACVEAAAIFLTYCRVVDAAEEAPWKLLVVAWLFFGDLIWLGDGYFQNEPERFGFGVLATVATLILCQAWFRLSLLGRQAANTLILLLVGLPLADWMIRPRGYVEMRHPTGGEFYSYERAKGDPTAFARWWECYQQQVDQMSREIFEPDPAGSLPFRLRPNSRGHFFDNPISINSRGFRGAEFPLDKGPAYRIVALGESTTFGLNLGREDKTWPELLEQMIRQRLPARRPVEVINAGVPYYSLRENLARLPRDILPLQPDMIISYHGFNGFFLIDRALQRPRGPPAPAYRERPLKLLADCEYRLKMTWYRRQRQGPVSPGGLDISRPLDTEYAGAYRQLIQAARANGICLVLANYSMAVNEQSDPAVSGFYAGGFGPGLFWAVKANAVHSLILEELARKYPWVCFVNTQPHLDGEHGKFTDLLHFTPAGNEQLAENIFNGIRKTLQESLAEPGLPPARKP